MIRHVVVSALLLAGSGACAAESVYSGDRASLYGDPAPVTRSIIAYAGHYPTRAMQTRAEQLCNGPASFIDAAFVESDGTDKPATRRFGYRFLCL